MSLLILFTCFLESPFQHGDMSARTFIQIQLNALIDDMHRVAHTLP